MNNDGPGIVFWAGSLGAFYCFRGNDVYRSPDGRSWTKIASNILVGECSSYIDVVDRVGISQVIWDETRRCFFAIVRYSGYKSQSYIEGGDLYSSTNGEEWTRIEGDGAFIYSENGEYKCSLSPGSICVSPARICVDSYYMSDDDGTYTCEEFYAVSKDNGATWEGYGTLFDVDWHHGGGDPDLIDLSGFDSVSAWVFINGFINRLNMFIGVANGNVMALSSDGENWYGVDDLDISGGFCYVQDRDTMMFYGDGGVIKVVTEFSEKLKNAWFKRLSLAKLKKADGSSSGSTPGGNSGDSGDGDAPIDTGRWERGIRLPGLFPGKN